MDQSSGFLPRLLTAVSSSSPRRSLSRVFSRRSQYSTHSYQSTESTDDTRNNDDGYSPEPDKMSRTETIAFTFGRQHRKGVNQGLVAAAEKHASKFVPAANRISWAFMIAAVAFVMGFMIIAVAYAYSVLFR